MIKQDRVYIDQSRYLKFENDMMDDAKIAEHIGNGMIDLRDRHKPGWYCDMARKLDGFNSPARFEKAVERAVALIEIQQAQLIDKSLPRLQATSEQVLEKARYARYLGGKRGVATPNANKLIMEFELSVLD